MNQSYQLSIIVPVFNEARRLDAGLNGLMSYLASAPRATELIVVDDGSSDNTAQLVESRLDGRPHARLIRVPVNRGKGFAVKTGMLAGLGAVRLFTDIDLSVPIATADRFYESCAAGTPVVIGTRQVATSRVLVRQARAREFLSSVFRRFTQSFVTPGLSDVTCGFKAFRAEVAEKIFQQSRIERWTFDAEILFLAQHYGIRVEEAPVEWSNSPETKVRLAIDLPRSLLELLRVRWNWACGNYRRQWIGEKSA